ncbi:type II secretion system protein GspM [uncultured Tateyamaria sp.]|uniref:type II secretion system protein GspM n=1 Tax=uncultured Tateyamaria sp. TaxID=455651 RepID=UPI002623AAF1|nr:type II secretion system protein GspM [uncultured Tateyamaria sp.]
MRKLSSREITISGAAAMAIGAAALWSVVIEPSLSTRSDSFAQLRKIDILWSVLDQVPDTLYAPQTAPIQPLRQRVTASARAAAIDIRRVDPQGAALSISLDDVAFTALIGWLETLTTTYGVQVFSAEIGRRPEPGRVSARIVMEDAQ